MSNRNDPNCVYWTCQNCGNKCLSTHREDECHCGEPDWKLDTYQKSYVVGVPDWVHPYGEV